MQVWSFRHRHFLNLAASSRTQACKWGPMDSAGSETPQSCSNQHKDNTSESQLPMAEILPSEPQDKQSVSLELFDDGGVDGIKLRSNVEQPSQESRLNPRRDSQPQDSVTHQEASVGAGTSTQGRARRMTRAMAESVSQQDFYGQSQMHYMA
jgi:hypothetical protein